MHEVIQEMCVFNGNHECFPYKFCKIFFGDFLNFVWKVYELVRALDNKPLLPDFPHANPDHLSGADWSEVEEMQGN